MTIDSDKDISYFARTTFRGQMRKFGIKKDDRRRHMYLIGKTGMGKSVMMENMAIADISKGNGVAYIDPHGDGVEKIIKYIPKERTNDIIYFNPADIDFPIAFNILETVDEEHKHLVASGLMGVFTKMWANVWSARMEYILNNCILALLDYPGSTLLGIPRILVDKAYRRKVVEKVKDPVVKSFWVTEFANYNERYRTEAIAPIQNKVGQFLSNFLIRNIVGQPKSTINLNEIMDKNKILLLNLSKGRIGEDNSNLLGAMMITKIQLAAMERVNIPEEERKDFYLYVDEFQNFATESFATILSEARKYRLNLIMGHQYIDQLVSSDSTAVRDSIFGNVGTMVSFRVGAKDAEYLEKEFDPVFMQKDLVNIEKWNVYIKLMIDGISSRPFSAIGLPPISKEELSGVTDMEKLIAVSRERCSRSRKSVEEKIMKWTGVEEIHRGVGKEAGIEEDQTRYDNKQSTNNRYQASDRPKKSNRFSKFSKSPRELEAVSVVKGEPQSISLESALNKSPVDFRGRPIKNIKKHVKQFTKEKINTQRPEKPKNPDLIKNQQASEEKEAKKSNKKEDGSLSPNLIENL